MPKPITRVSYALNDADGYATVLIDSRDIVQLESKYRDVTATSLFADLSFTNLYRLLFVALRRRGTIPMSMTLPEFTEAYLVRASVGDEIEYNVADEDEDQEGESDPT